MGKTNRITEKKRQSGIDLIRCVAFLFVVVFHSFLNNGHSYVLQEGNLVWLADTFRFLSISCIGLYLMLTGYLRCENTDIKSCYRGLVSVLVGYLLACFIAIPIRHYVFEEVMTFSDWIKKIFDFTAIRYGWYVEMYIGLALLIPFINMALKHIGDNKKKLYILAAVLLLMTALPGATTRNIAPDYWRIAYPITYYVLGAIVCKLQPKFDTWIGLLEAVAMAGLLGAYTVITNDSTYRSQTLQFEFQDIWIVIIVVLVFISLYRVKIPKVTGKVLAFMASGCYCGYLLSSLFDAYCYPLVNSWKNPEQYYLIFLCVTLPIYIVSILCGAFLQKITDIIVPKKKKTTE